jgi:CTP:molybdopterin cytidylyltransferase MocA
VLANIPGIVLAAGHSRRMGRCKALLPLQGRPLVMWHTDRLARAGFRPLIVSDTDHALISASCPGAEHLHAPGASDGQPIDSLRRALLTLATPRGALVMPVDIAPPTPEVLEALLPHADLVPVGPDGLKGHPVRISAHTCDAIRAAPPLGGLRTLLRGASTCLVNHSVSRDFDTPQSWAVFEDEWRKRGGGG